MGKVAKGSIYARVSTETQVERGQGLDVQLKLCRDYCRKRKVQVLGEYVDEGVSGATIDRDGLQDLLAHLNGADAVIVANTSRLWREDITRALIQRELKKADKDVVAVAGAYSVTRNKSCQVPYGALVPAKVDGLLAAGRCVAADNKMMNYTRLIAPCFVLGQAAGAAAALAVKDNCRPRDVEVPRLQALLKKQGAYLG